MKRDKQSGLFIPKDNAEFIYILKERASSDFNP